VVLVALAGFGFYSSLEIQHAGQQGQREMVAGSCTGVMQTGLTEGLFWPSARGHGATHVA
jgi:lipopolysaccharide export LptBFGC system permease protein LptF